MQPWFVKALAGWLTKLCPFFPDSFPGSLNAMNALMEKRWIRGERREKAVDCLALACE